MRDNVTVVCKLDDTEMMAAMEGLAKANGLTELRTEPMIWMSWTRAPEPVPPPCPQAGARLLTLAPVKVYKGTSITTAVWGTLPAGNSQMVVESVALVDNGYWLKVHKALGLWVLWDPVALREKV